MIDIVLFEPEIPANTGIIGTYNFIKNVSTRYSFFIWTLVNLPIGLDGYSNEMDRISVKGIELEGVFLENLYDFLDDDGAVILLSLLWTVYLACKSTVHGWHITGTFDQSAPRSAS